MTDIILNQLYPGGIMKQLADAAGGIVYDQYAAGGCIGQLNAASGLDDPLDQYAAGGPLHQIEVELEGGGGGGGEPDWVPANAAIHIDLVGGDPQGRAWVEGTGVVAVDTLLGNDPNTENGVDGSDYDPEFLTVNGYGDGTGSPPDPALIGALLASYVAGCTVRFQFYQNVDASGPTVSLLSADGNDAIETYFINSDDLKTGIRSWNGDLDLEITGTANAGTGAVNALAATIIAARAELAANGSNAGSGEVTEEDRPAGNPLIAAMISLSGQALQSITLYDALPSTAGLSALSEIT